MTPIEEVRDLFLAANTETQFRTVASRSYYAAYASIMPIAASLGFVATTTGRDHSLVAQFLSAHSNPLLRRIGKDRLPRLRKIRNRADYELQTGFTRGLAEEALRTAEEVVGWINALVQPSGNAS
jgi:hypothetical protein